MASQVFDKDMGWANIMKSLGGSGVDKLSAFVGPDPTVFQTEQEAYYPLYVEYGTRRMAARPFMRWTLDAHDNYLPQLRKLADRVITRSKDGDLFLSMAASLRSLADAVANDIRVTIKGMGAIDTARMYHSVKCLRVVIGDDATGGSVVANWGNQ